MPNCPLCLHPELKAFIAVHGREYHRCPNCLLIVLDQKHWLTAEAEKARYELHQNNPQDPGYRKFLKRLADPLRKLLPAKATGLDFGCGPGPTLSALFEEQGYSMQKYDPYFFPDAACLEQQYDFVTCTEVLEHLRNPRSEIEKMVGLLYQGGTLAVMTELLTPQIKFSDWPYIRDQSHVAFYCPETMEWIANDFKLTMASPHTNVRLFRKK